MDEYDIFSFTANEDALYAYVKVIRQEPVMNGSYYNSTVYNLLLGEKIEIYNSDEFGVVHKDYFNYKINPLYW